MQDKRNMTAAWRAAAVLMAPLWLGGGGQVLAAQLCQSIEAQGERVSAQAAKCVDDPAPEPPPPPAHGAQFVSQSVATTMVAGQSYPVTVTLKNTGTATWNKDDAYRLGSQNPRDNTNWGLQRVVPPAAIGNGQTAAFSFTVRAPTAAGSHNFQWRMVQDGVAWFGATTPNQAISVVQSVIKGNIDGITDGNLTGWACSTYLDHSIDVHLYVGGAAGTGTMVGSHAANRSSEAAVATACSAKGAAYRFSIPLASLVSKYAARTLHVHGISPVGANNAAIAGSGKFAVPANQPPKVQLTAPANGASVPTLSTLKLAATASDLDDGVASVEFQVDGRAVKTATAAPYEHALSGLGEGSHQVRAVVRDTRGAAVISATATVSVRAPASGDAGVTTVYSSSTEYDELGRVIAERGNNGQA
ncbi:MAG: Ig-like domain-containing protein, partial [Pseudomonas sp.]